MTKNYKMSKNQIFKIPRISDDDWGKGGGH